LSFGWWNLEQHSCRLPNADEHTPVLHGGIVTRQSSGIARYDHADALSPLAPACRNRIPVMSHAIGEWDVLSTPVRGTCPTVVMRACLEQAVAAIQLLHSLCFPVVTGCTASRGYPMFDREQTAEDELPAEFDKLELDEFDLTTSRFSATQGVDYYLVKRAEAADGGPTECVAIADSQWP
jgi:hypothetical protein